MLLLLLALLQAGTAHADSTFKVRLHEDLGTLDWNFGEVNGEVVNQLMEGLFRADHQGKPVPAAAESFQWNQDKTKLSVQLKKGRLWSDGEPVCAQHFVESWNRLQSKEFASPFAHYANVIKSAVAPSCEKLEVEFTRSAPEAPALFAQLMFFPVRIDVVKRKPKVFLEGVGMPVNGPFLVKEWKPNSLLVLEPNPRFQGEKAKISRIYYRFIPDDASAKALFDLGEIDWMKDVPQLLRLPALEKSAVFRKFPTLVVYYFGLNAEKSTLLKNRSVREALSFSLDRREIPRILGAECRGTLSWLLPELSPGVRGRSGKPSAEAIKLLKDAAKSGKLDLRLKVYSKTAHKLLAEWAQGQWEKKLGVRIPIEVLESKVYWKEMGSNPAPIFFGGVTAPYGHPRALLQEFLSTSTANWTGWSSAAYDAAVSQGRYPEAERILEEGGQIIPIYQRDTVALVQTRWKGFHVNPLGQVFLNEIE